MNGDVLQKVLSLSTGAGTFNKIVSEEILQNVFDCVIVNLKRYHISDKFVYISWLRMFERNKQKENIDHPQLNNYFEEELKMLFSKTCSESIFGSCLPNRLRHFSRRVGIGKKRNLTLKQKRKRKTKKYANKKEFYS